MISKFSISIIISALTLLLSAHLSAQSKKTSFHKPGQTFKDCNGCPEMIIIPAGSFMMGSKNTEPGHGDEEGPQKKISIRQFACGKFDITKAQWAAFVKATNRPATGGCSWAALPGDTGKPWNPNPEANWNHIGFVQDSSHPVVCITWYDAHDYVTWLSKKTGFTYRLLSEAEWEYAARAGKATAYYWGDSITHESANYGVDTAWGMGCIKGRDQWLYTSPVGSFPPNSFGLYDMFGNVNQYLADCFEGSYKNLPANGSPYQTNINLKMTGDLKYMNGTTSCAYRMIRGGDFGDPPQMLRAAYRNWAPAPGSALKMYSSSGVGFRVARTL